MTEMGEAVERLKAAEEDHLRVMRLSTRALIRGGFVVAECGDPKRLAVVNEIASEAKP